MTMMTLSTRALLAAVLLLTAAVPLRAADALVRGREIYRQQCVKCHGKGGEGVKGKYNDALVGDWSLEKLTRYIDKNMPENDPDLCNGEDAVAVARFIFDSFYSREARARNNPARVELVRLTNRQFVNTVSDILRGFSPADPPLGNERGLRGSYRVGKRGDARGNFERTDAKVDFSFDKAGPDAQKFGTNDYRISWTGSVIATESGDHEIILKTPNGARLWLNDDENPLIDAGVASGDDTEHRARLRLIGGRAYPVRLEMNKAPKDKRASVALLWKQPRGVVEVIPARCLSPVRVAPTFVLSTPFPADDSSVGYERGVNVSKSWDEAATHAAIEVANHVAKNIDRLAGTKPGATNRAVKAEAFCREFVGAAFRRPLTGEQKRAFVTAPFKSATKVEDAVKRVVLLALKSPRFLYLGLDDAQPDDFVVASRLSFGLWDSVPDKDLLKAAAQGALRSREQAAAQARRMLGDARARAKMREFLHHWLQMDHVEDLSKDATLFPGFTPEIISDLRASLDLFLDQVVWSQASDYRRLLLEDDLFVNERLAKFYGFNTNAADSFVKVDSNPKERSGVVTHPYLLAAFAYQKSTSPIHRGVFLTRNIVGRVLRPPPVAVAFKDADFKPGMTMRQKVEELTRPQACHSCHAVINPLGFSLENYDAVGRFRTRDGDKPVDAAGEYTTDDGRTVRLTGARDVAEFAVKSEHAHNAFVELLFHQLVKQPMLAYGLDAQDDLRRSFVASEFNVQKLAVDIVTLSSLHGLPKAK
jgi:hypothetical protein